MKKKLFYFKGFFPQVSLFGKIFFFDASERKTTEKGKQETNSKQNDKQKAATKDTKEDTYVDKLLKPE